VSLDKSRQTLATLNTYPTTAGALAQGLQGRLKDHHVKCCGRHRPLAKGALSRSAQSTLRKEVAATPLTKSADGLRPLQY